MLNWPGSVPGSPHERSRVPSGANERLAAHIGRRLAGDADGQQHLAVERAVSDGVVAVVGEPESVVRRHVDAVRAAKHPFAPGAQEVALAVEHDHRVLAPIEGVHPVLRVDPDRGHVGVELPPRRQLRPVVDDLVPIGARAQNDRLRHVSLLGDSPRNTLPARPGGSSGLTGRPHPRTSRSALGCARIRTGGSPRPSRPRCPRARPPAMA